MEAHVRCIFIGLILEAHARHDFYIDKSSASKTTVISRASGEGPFARERVLAKITEDIMSRQHVLAKITEGKTNLKVFRLCVLNCENCTAFADQYTFRVVLFAH